MNLGNTDEEKSAQRIAFGNAVHSGRAHCGRKVKLCRAPAEVKISLETQIDTTGDVVLGAWVPVLIYVSTAEMLPGEPKLRQEPEKKPRRRREL